MYLYHAITIYQLLLCICINISQRRNEKSVLILPDFIKKKFKGYNLLEKYGFFDKVVLYPYERIPLMCSMKMIESVGDKVYSSLRIPTLKDYVDIFCAGTQFVFASYLVAKKRCFNYIEEASGQFLNVDDFRLIQEKLNPTMYRLADGNGLYDASSSYVKKIYADVPAEYSAGDGRVIRYNLVEELSKLSLENIDKLRKIFGISEFMHPPLEKSCVFITDSVATHGLITWEEQIERNLLTIDYFFQQSYLIIKPHPDDYVPYKKLFPKATILPQQFPIELFDNFMENVSTHVIVYASTAARSIRAKDIVSFTWEWQIGEFCKLHRYFIIYKLYEHINRLMDCKFCYSGTNGIVFENWRVKGNINCDELERAQGCVYVFIDCDYVSKEEICRILSVPNRILVFERIMDSFIEIINNEQYLFLIKNLEITDSRKMEVKNESICLLTNNNVILSMAKEFHYDKFLKNTQKRLKVKNLQDKSEGLLLKEKLKICEERLLCAVKENEQLKKHLKEMG